MSPASLSRAAFIIRPFLLKSYRRTNLALNLYCDIQIITPGLTGKSFLVKIRLLKNINNSLFFLDIFPKNRYYKPFIRSFINIEGIYMKRKPKA
jgi:hypothetical protein